MGSADGDIVIMHRNYISLSAIFFFVVLSGMFFFSTSSANNPNIYRTTHGSGPDKWASVWLLERAGVGRVQITEKDNIAEQRGTWFDVPGALLNRTASSTTMDALMSSLQLNDQYARKLAEIIHDIEIGAWRSERSAESEVVELGFRGLQTRFGRLQPGKRCYSVFFDRVAAALKIGSLSINTNPESLIPDASCSQLVRKKPLEDLPRELPLVAVLEALANGKEVVFVDTREFDEFSEVRLPQAVHLPLRNINKNIAASLASADLVVAYCVKDGSIGAKATNQAVGAA